MFTGAVLTGGASRRMGRDKALLDVGGVPLALRVASVLGAAGAARVLAVGGDGHALRALGLEWCPDDHPGEGPLGGILTALGSASTDVVAVVATDLPDLTPDAVARVVGALTHEVDVALATTAHAAPPTSGDAAASAPPRHLDDAARPPRLEPLCGAWRRRAEPALRHAFVARGERAIHRALDGLVVARVPLPAPWLRNVNTPADLGVGP